MATLKMHVSLEDPHPSDLSGLIESLSRLDLSQGSTLDFCLICSSNSQAGQIARRVNEQLGPNCRLRLEAQHDPAVVVLASSDDKTTSGGIVSEGVHRVRIADAEVIDQGARVFLDLDFEVVGGPGSVANGRRFNDLVLVFPPHPRGEHFAKAVGIDLDAATKNPSILIGRHLIDRRVREQKADGSEHVANYYVPDNGSSR